MKKAARWWIYNYLEPKWGPGGFDWSVGPCFGGLTGSKIEVIWVPGICWFQKILIFTPILWEIFQSDAIIFVRWAETTR